MKNETTEGKILDETGSWWSSAIYPTEAFLRRIATEKIVAEHKNKELKKSLWERICSYKFKM